ncbi:MAG: ester cyclase [Alphaproteobacteria bacterium]
MIERRQLLARISGAVALSAAVLAGWFGGAARAQGMSAMKPQEMVDLFQKHVGAEIAGDLDTTMATMTDNPHLHNIPTMIGGAGRDGVRAFYRDHLVGKFFPPDMTMTPVSRTVGETQVVDELVISFTHTTVIDWMLPGVAPTGRRVEAAFAVIVGFKDGKISHEHIYWDQASVLVQLGLLDPKGLPVSGAESARRVIDPTLPTRKL